MNKLTAAIAALSILTTATQGFAQSDQSNEPTLPAARRSASTIAVLANSLPPRTRLEGMLARKDAVIVKGYSEIQTLSGQQQSSVRVLAVEFTDTSRQAKETGIALEVHQANQPDHIAVAYVDYSEIDRLVAGLEALEKLEPTATKLSNVDASYRTQGDLEVQHIDQNGARLATVRAVQIPGPGIDLVWATAYFAPAQLADLGKQIQMAKQTLDEIKPQNK